MIIFNSLNKRPFDETIRRRSKILRFFKHFDKRILLSFQCLINYKYAAVFRPLFTGWGDHMSRLIAYARVSTLDHFLSIQIDELKVADSKRIFSDKISGARAERPSLVELLKTLRTGDKLIVWRQESLEMSLSHFIFVVTGFIDKIIGFKSLQDLIIYTTTAVGKLNLPWLQRLASSIVNDNRTHVD